MIKYGEIIITEVTDVIDITISLMTESYVKLVIAVGINSLLYK